MNRKTTTALVSAAFFGIAGTALAVYAAGGHEGGMHEGPPPAAGPGMEFMLPGMMGPQLLHRLGDELGLTQPQRDSIKSLLESARPNMQALREEMRATAEQLRATQPDAGNYSAVVAQASKKAGELASRLVTDGSQLRAQIWQVLTPEQRTKLQSIGDDFRQRRQERGMHHRPPPPPGDDAQGASLNKSSSAEATPASDLMVVSAARIRV